MLKTKNNLLIKLLLITLVALGLTACAKKKVYHAPPPPPPTVKQLRHQAIRQLELNNVQVIHLGETMRLVLRSDDMFQPDSANLRDCARQTLVTVAQLLRLYEKVNVKVAAYTDEQGKYDRQQALTTRQAQVISTFLWSHGVDARLMYAVGFNRLNAVDWNGSATGRSMNRRVEISFSYFPIVKSYN